MQVDVTKFLIRFISELTLHGHEKGRFWPPHRKNCTTVSFASFNVIGPELRYILICSDGTNVNVEMESP
jgi:hypothetical protein